ncbi:MAG: bifunctional fucokinase/L-fucose-1-P-guanylyltransferase [Bacteroidaceae bacterium]|nr:bifunctional fucokinase/L-fucose-1-P-guanylyltransferase [Bacteroidaceae bacterium]
MKTLLSLPPNLVHAFHRVTGKDTNTYFCTSDPAGRKLGSGGGTTWLIEDCFRKEAEGQCFDEWLAQEKRILLHAGGQSRRLPMYAPSGKVLTPIPVFRWQRGQHIDQNLLDLQLPLYERILNKAPENLKTLIASGDVYIRATQPLQNIPEADVVCYGLWADPELASHHGVFVMNRNHQEHLDFMLQKPSIEEQAKWMQTHYILMDIGVWLLSDRAVKALLKKAPVSETGEMERPYDLYSEFGCALGDNPSKPDADLADLSVAILPLPGGEFYHFGTTPELLSSTEAIQNLIKDQRFIIQREVKRQSSVFTQNCVVANRANNNNEQVWIENSHLGLDFHFTKRNVITGVPSDKWAANVREGVCVDVVPIGEKAYALRPYGFNDTFRGPVSNSDVTFIEQPWSQWLAQRNIPAEAIGNTADIQAASIFPVCDNLEELGALLQWMIAEQGDDSLTTRYLELPRLSADEIAIEANLDRLVAQRKSLMAQNLPAIAENWKNSIFYQLDLKDVSEKYNALQIPTPKELTVDAPLMTKIHDAMFRGNEEKAFSLLREGLTNSVLAQKSHPKKCTYDDQIVWSRSSVRIDLAGGWTDTPPYSLMTGGNVVNLAIEMNGQQPLQVYVKPSKDYAIICRSIDLGAIERIETYEELRQFNRIGSPFSIPKAAMALSGFLPGFGQEEYPTLKQQLEAFGCGIEITLLSAIPAGSGLGTSSILAATVLGALSDFCALGWDKNEICKRTLVLEQLLTTGGGWQDQYGGVLHGVKLLQTQAGFDQSAVARWAPDTIFTDPDKRFCHLLFYTGVTRTAKNILAEIVKGMFLNSSTHLSLLNDMKQHALAMYDALQTANLDTYGMLLRQTWEQNKALDAGTNPPVIEEICKRVDDLCTGYKLPGAGGGGFMYMVAKDVEAANRIRESLTNDPITKNSRFIDMSVSTTGLQVSRS